MKSTLLPMIAVGAISGIVGALLVTAVKATDREANAAGSTQSEAWAEGQAELRSLLAEMKLGQDELAERVQSLEIRPPAESARTDVAQVQSPLADLSSEDLDKLMASVRASDGAIPLNIQDHVQSSLQQIREDEDRERDEARQQARIDRLDGRIAELTSELGLGTAQATDLRNAYLDRDMKRDELRDLGRETGDWGSMRDQFRALEEESDARVKEALTPDQYDRLQEMDDGGRGGFGGGRRGGDRGNNGGGGGGSRRG